MDVGGRCQPRARREVDYPRGVDIPLPVSPASGPPSLVDLIATGTLDADLAALLWLLVEGEVPLVVVAPEARLGAAAQLLDGILGSIRPDVPAADPARPMGTTAARRLIRGREAGSVMAGTSLEDVFRSLRAGPLPLGDDELTFLGCVLVLGSGAGTAAAGSAPAASAPAGSLAPGSPAAGSPAVGRVDADQSGRLRVVAAHYVRPLARDAHGHSQRLGPAVLATWDAAQGRYEHFGWGIWPEIAARLGRRAGDMERDLHHRRDDLGTLASAGVTGVSEVRRLIAGYQAGYQSHDTAAH